LPVRRWKLSAKKRPSTLAGWEILRSTAKVHGNRPMPSMMMPTDQKSGPRPGRKPCTIGVLLSGA